GFVFQSNYRSGLRIFDARDPFATPVEVGYFDTFLGSDITEFDGAWSNYPYFPSGNVIVSDIQGGLFVLDPTFALIGGTPLDITLTSSIPENIAAVGQAVQVSVAGLNGNSVAPATVTLHIEDSSGVREVQLTNTGGETFTGTFGGLSCGDSVRYWFSAETMDGVVVNEPLSAPAITFEGLVATDLSASFEDDFESDTGWTVGAPFDTATSGIWVRADPFGTAAQPANDNPAGSGTLCYITGNQSGAGLGDDDIDNGATTLTSPTLDATGDGIAFIRYYRWYSNDQGASPGQDTMIVEISNDNGATWSLLEEVDENANTWVQRRFRVSDHVTPTDAVRIRFIASDTPPGSIVEAGVDDVAVLFVECASGSPADLDADGSVGSSDLGTLLGSWGACAGCPADLDGNGTVDAADLAIMLGSWG
ncbi:MAG: hypothetical protein VYC34_00910, partial [Planctomycetota bacterium]|nr:hypothetical protein [Planctomycetota bacterium]